MWDGLLFAISSYRERSDFVAVGRSVDANSAFSTLVLLGPPLSAAKNTPALRSFVKKLMNAAAVGTLLQFWLIANPDAYRGFPPEPEPVGSSIGVTFPFGSMPVSVVCTAAIRLPPKELASTVPLAKKVPSGALGSSATLSGGKVAPSLRNFSQEFQYFVMTSLLKAIFPSLVNGSLPFA